MKEMSQKIKRLAKVQIWISLYKENEQKNLGVGSSTDLDFIERI